METMYTNDESFGHHKDANGADESGIISHFSLTTEVPEDVEHNAEINQQQLNVLIAEQNHELMQLLSRRDKTIENMSTVHTHIETQLQVAVSAKLDALARLEKIEGKEMNLQFKEKQMDLDAERVSKNIENLTENLNKTVASLTAARKEQASASDEFEIEMKRKREQLRKANLSVSKLSETNQMLKTQNEKYAYKLQQQMAESDKLIEWYEKDLKAKIELANLYKQNRDDYQAQVEELTAAIAEMRTFLNEVVDGNGLLETALNEIQLDRKAESDEMVGIIGKLKQELEDANRLLKEYHNCDDDKGDIGMDVDFRTSNNHPVVKGMTVTEMYSQYCSVVEELHHKEREYEFLEGEMKYLINDVTEKAIQFNEQQKELKNLQAINEESIEERKNNLVIKMVSLMEKDKNRSRCEQLTAENNELKSIMKRYEADCLKHPVELEQQNQQLIAKIQEMNSVEVLISEIYEVRGADESTSCHKSVQVVEAELMTEGNFRTRDIPNVKSQEAKIDELAQKNTKLQADVQKLSAENNWLVAEANLVNIRKNARENQIQTLEDRNQNQATLIYETHIANEHLREAKANVTMKLVTVESQLQHLQKENLLLSEMKQSLIAEAETLKRDLVQQEIANKVVSDATVQTDTGIERHEESTSETNRPDVVVITMLDCSPEKKSTFLHSPPLTMSDQQRNTATETPKVNRFKRSADECNDGESGSSTTATGCSKRLRSKKNRRVQFVDLSEDDDEIINVCDVDEGGVSPTAELQFLSEVRTRHQAKFIRDAFHSRESQPPTNVKVEPLDDEKVSQPKRTRSSARGRSHSSRGSRSSTRAGRGQNSSRSRSVGHQQSSDSRWSVGQQTATCGNQNEVAIKRRSRRLMSRMRDAILENNINVTDAGDGNEMLLVYYDTSSQVFLQVT